MLLEKAENYTKTSIELAKLQAVDKVADVVSSLVSVIVIAIVVGVILMLTNLGLAFWLGELFGNTYYGFFTLAGFYLLIALVVISMNKQLIKIPVSNILITSLLKEKQR